MQYKVPQNIDIEDKVIGPLTLKQFIYLIVGAGTLAVIKFSLPLAIGFLFMPIAVIVGAFFAAMAFYQPGDRPFEVYLLSIITSFTKPKKRVWKKLPYKEEKNAGNKALAKEPEEKDVKSEDLARLAFLVDSGGFEDELRSKGFIAAMQEDKKLLEPSDLGDTLSASEAPNEGLKGLLNLARKKTKEEKREPSIQEMASVSPDKEYKYEKLGETARQKEYNSLLDLAKKRQEDRFEEARILK